MTKYIRYIGYVLIHKWHCFWELLNHGLLIQAITHDLSKFSPSEATAYAAWFSDEDFNKLKQALHNTLEPSTNDEYRTKKQAFDVALLYHYRSNPHHWQYWCYPVDQTKLTAIEMPKHYATEMFCDWIAAGLAINGSRDVESWYKANRDKMILHSETRKFVETLITTEMKIQTLR